MFEFFIYCFILFWLVMGLVTNYLYVKKKTEVEKQDIRVKELKMLGVVMILGPIAFWWRHVDYVLFKAKSD